MTHRSPLSSLLLLIFCLLVALPGAASASDGNSAGNSDGAELEPEGPALAEARDAYFAGRWDEALVMFEAAYTGAGSDAHLAASAALEWGNLLWEMGEYDRAETRVRQALELARANKIDSAIGRLLLALGQVEMSKGKLRDAENTFNICVRLAGEQRDATFAALCRINHRLVRTLQGKSVTSDAAHQRDIAAIEASGTPLTVGTSLARTGELYQQNGNYAAALAMLEKADEQFRAAGSVPSRARNHARIASVLQDLGRFDEARTRLDAAIRQFEAMNNRPALVNALGLRSRDAAHRGDTAGARAHLERALGFANQTKSPQLIARSHLGLCELTGQSAAQAAEHCTRAASLFERTGIPSLAARSKGQLARLHQAAGQLEPARALYVEVIEIMEKRVERSSRDASGLAVHHANLCQVELGLETPGIHKRCLDAIAAFEALPAAERARHDAMITATHYAAGVGAATNKSHQSALEHLERAAARAEAATPPNVALAADAWLRLGAVQAGLSNQRPRAEASFRKGLALAAADSAQLATRLQLRTQLSQLLLADAKFAAAAIELEALRDEARAASQPASEAWASNGLAQAYLKLGRRDDAVRALQSGLVAARRAGDAELVSTFEDNLARLK